MKKRLIDFKLAAILSLLAVTNFAVDGYPTIVDPECEECGDDYDEFQHCDISIRFEPPWISVFAGETSVVNASCFLDDARWTARAWDWGEGLLNSASASPGPASLSAVAVVSKDVITPSYHWLWGGRPRYAEAKVYVSASVTDESSSWCRHRHGGETFKVLGLIDQLDTTANISADPGGSGWLDLQVTKKRYTSSPGDWAFSAALENPADSQFVTGLSAAPTGAGTARVSYSAADDITPPAWCDPGRPYCSIRIPVKVTAVKVGGGGFSITETASISVLLRMPS